MPPKSLFVCQSCGNEFAKWSGQCSACKEWNSLVETPVSAKVKSSKSKVKSSGRVEPIDLSSLSPLPDRQAGLTSNLSRIPTGLSEFDQVLSGGFVPGQVVLLAGEPGIGKSTLLLQIADSLASEAQNPKSEIPASPAGGRNPKQIKNSNLENSKIVSNFDIRDSDLEPQVLYVCGEESPSQIQLRASRLGLKGANIQLLPQTDVDAILEVIENWKLPAKGGSASGGKIENSPLLIIDSVQTLTTSDLVSAAGSVAQVKECAARLTRLAKEKGLPTVLVGHVNKEGDIAGPKVLEHLVDAVLYFEGERTGQLRLLRSIKNRFGQVGETGVFEMTDRGFKEVPNPSARFLSQSAKSSPGSVLSVIMEGSRPLLLEIQALTVKSSFNYPRRAASGFDLNRLYFLCAVIEKHLKIPLSGLDVYVNVTAGISISEPAADLPVALAIISSARGEKLQANGPAFGELGLSGEVRPVSFEPRRIKEAQKLGFQKILSPQTVKSLIQAVQQALGEFKV